MNTAADILQFVGLILVMAVLVDAFINYFDDWPETEQRESGAGEAVELSRAQIDWYRQQHNARRNPAPPLQ